jgi:diguanylate cyclase (GGDEF)-like protein
VIDLRTLLILVAVADAMAAAVLWLGAGRRSRHGVIAWLAALMARALAVSLVAARIEPIAGTLAMAAGLLALSMTEQANALLAHQGKHLPTWTHSAVIAAVVVPLSLLASDPTNAILFGGLVFGSLLAVLTMIALHAPATANSWARGRQVLAATFGLGAGVFYVRGVAAVLSAEPLAAFSTPNGFQSACYVAACAAALVSTYGFMLLTKERAEGEAARLATMDPLTGAYSRRTFHEIAERELSRARRAGQPFSMILFDIDHFRRVNEQHGHHTGDRVLQRIADIARGALRKEDMLVRFGGDEFLVMLPEVPGPGAVVVAGRIRKALEAEAVEVDALHIPLTASVGVSARLDEGPESIENLIARADEARSLAKQRGRNRVVALSLGRSMAA